MSNMLKFLFSVVMFALILNTLLGTVLASKTARILKDDIELALHDAGLNLDLEALSEGYIIFDPLAENLFEYSFYSYNVNFYENVREVIDFQVFDDSNTVFPVIYDGKVIEYPTILATARVRANGGNLLKRDLFLTRTGAYTIYR